MMISDSEFSAHKTACRDSFLQDLWNDLHSNDLGIPLASFCNLDTATLGKDWYTFKADTTLRVVYDWFNDQHSIGFAYMILNSHSDSLKDVDYHLLDNLPDSVICDMIKGEQTC